MNPRTVLKVGATVALVGLVLMLLLTSLFDQLEGSSALFDIGWKVLIVVLLIDIRLQLGKAR